MPRKKVSSTVYLEAWQHEALQELSRRTNVPVAYYVRMGVDLALEQHGVTRPEGPGERP